jgi:hypothetical protein
VDEPAICFSSALILAFACGAEASSGASSMNRL